MAAVQRITRQFSEERASVLAKQAVDLAHTGHNEDASRKLREAAALGPDNIDVQAAFLAIHNEQARSPLLDMVRRYALYHDQKAGDDAVRYLRSPDAANSAVSALECLQIILENNQASLSSSQDSIIAELSRQNHLVRQYFATELEKSTTEFFENVYVRGDESANCLRSVVLNPSLWQNDETRLRVEDDLFQLFLAKLMENGHDHDGRALKGIALLLMADIHRLHTFIDEEACEALLSSLDYRLPPDVRGQATLVLSKYLEVSEQTGQQYFTKFITSHVAKRKGDDLILAFSAAAQLFPVASAMTAQLFLMTGFLPAIMPQLERSLSSQIVHDSFLALLSGACIDGACRESIQQYCAPWLSHKVSNGKGKQPAMAATILAKLRTSGTRAQDQRANKADDDVSELVDLFKATLNVEEGRNISDSIEGLAYTSLKPEVKEKLAHDPQLLKRLLAALDNNPTIPEIVVGGLSVFANITQYPPNQSEEQKRMSQLKAYANASKLSEPNPLEDDEHIRARCSAVVDVGIMPTLGRLNKTGSSATALLTDKILLSLTKSPKDRGKIAQQGAVKILVLHAQKEISNINNTPNHEAAHALARVLISLDPSHIFPAGSTPHIADAIPPLAALLKQAPSEGLSDQPRDLLPVFESLLALTNLASSPDSSAANSIIRLAGNDTEDFLLGNNIMLRRAACELICNLCSLPAGAAKFADGSKGANQRLHVLIGMADVDDLPTRRAAGGALAMLTEYEPVVDNFLSLSRGAEILLDLCQDDDPGVMHRGLVVVRNILCDTEGETNIKAKHTFKENDGVEKLKTSLKKTKDPNLLQIGVDALKALI